MSLTLVIMCCSNIVIIIIIIELFSYLSSNKIETRFDMKYYLGGWEVKKKPSVIIILLFFTTYHIKHLNTHNERNETKTVYFLLCSFARDCSCSRQRCVLCKWCRYYIIIIITTTMIIIITTVIIGA